MITFLIGFECFTIGAFISILVSNYFFWQMRDSAKRALDGWQESIKIGEKAVEIIKELRTKLQAYEKIPSQSSGVSND